MFLIERKVIVTISSSFSERERTWKYVFPIAINTSAGHIASRPGSDRVVCSMNIFFFSITAFPGSWISGTSLAGGSGTPLDTHIYILHTHTHRIGTEPLDDVGGPPSNSNGAAGRWRHTALVVRQHQVLRIYVVKQRDPCSACRRNAHIPHLLARDVRAL